MNVILKTDDEVQRWALLQRDQTWEWLSIKWPFTQDTLITDASDVLSRVLLGGIVVKNIGLTGCTLMGPSSVTHDFTKMSSLQGFYARNCYYTGCMSLPSSIQRLSITNSIHQNLEDSDADRCLVDVNHDHSKYGAPQFFRAKATCQLEVDIEYNETQSQLTDLRLCRASLTLFNLFPHHIAGNSNLTTLVIMGVYVSQYDLDLSNCDHLEFCVIWNSIITRVIKLPQNSTQHLKDLDIQDVKGTVVHINRPQGDPNPPHKMTVPLSLVLNGSMNGYLNDGLRYLQIFNDMNHQQGELDFSHIQTLIGVRYVDFPRFLKVTVPAQCRYVDDDQDGSNHSRYAFDDILDSEVVPGMISEDNAYINDCSMSWKKLREWQ